MCRRRAQPREAEPAPDSIPAFFDFLRRCACRTKRSSLTPWAGAGSRVVPLFPFVGSLGESAGLACGALGSVPRVPFSVRFPLCVALGMVLVRCRGL